MWCVPPPFSLVNDNLVALEPHNVDLRDALNSCASMQVNASDPMAGFGQKSLQVDVPMAEKMVVSPAGGDVLPSLSGQRISLLFLPR